MITGKLYDWLKWAAQIFLPAFGTLYFTMAGIWDFGSADEVIGTIMAIDLFLGVLLGISQMKYSKTVDSNGEMHISEDGRFQFQIDADKTDIDKFGELNEVRFKVKKTTEHSDSSE